MLNSGYDRHQPIIKNRAAGYNKTLVAFQNAPFLEMMTPFAAGSLYSTVEDLYLWDQALYTDKLISKETKEKMFTPLYINNSAFYHLNKYLSNSQSRSSHPRV